MLSSFHPVMNLSGNFPSFQHTWWLSFAIKCHILWFIRLYFLRLDSHFLTISLFPLFFFSFSFTFLRLNGDFLFFRPFSITSTEFDAPRPYTMTSCTNICVFLMFKTIGSERNTRRCETRLCAVQWTIKIVEHLILDVRTYVGRTSKQASQSGKGVSRYKSCFPVKDLADSIW